MVFFLKTKGGRSKEIIIRTPDRQNAPEESFAFGRSDVPNRIEAPTSIVALMTISSSGSNA